LHTFGIGIDKNPHGSDSEMSVDLGSTMLARNSSAVTKSSTVLDAVKLPKRRTILTTCCAAGPRISKAVRPARFPDLLEFDSRHSLVQESWR